MTNGLKSLGQRVRDNDVAEFALMLVGTADPNGVVGGGESTLYWDRVGNIFYVNRDGATAWSAQAPGAGAVFSHFAALPMLRAFWTMGANSVIGAADHVSDQSGGYNFVINNNAAQHGYDGFAPYVEFDGATEWLHRPDAGPGDEFDILGTEAYIVPAYRGLTFGGWFYFNNAAAANEGLISKDDNAAATSSYYIYRTAAGNATGRVSSGAAFFTVTLAGTAQTTWQFIVMRYIPSTEIKVWINEASNTNVVAIPAALQDSPTDFEIGRRGDASQYLDGRASMCFICAGQLSDAIISNLYTQSRGLFGV